MPKYIEMPKLSDTMTEGTLLKWRIKPGDKVKVGDIIADIETDKATMEMEAFQGGIVHKLYINESEKVPLGAYMGILLGADEAPPADDGPPVKKAPAAASEAPKASGSSLGFAIPGSRAGGARRSSGSAAAQARVKASPLARKIAAEKNVDLTRVTGTGPQGRVVKADVLDAAANKSSSGSSTPAIRPTVGVDDTRTPLSSMRTIIAQRLLTSKQQIPHFYLNIEVDAGPLMKFRAEANKKAEQDGTGVKYTINDFILLAVAKAAQVEKRVNASFDVDGIVQFGHVNLSVAIAVEDGLVTPVIRDAEKKSLAEISAAVKDLAKRAKDKKLKPDEFADGTITISNLGAYGINNFDAIINPPQAAILSVGAITKQPVVNAEGQIVAGERMWIGMSCDHRVVDGAVGATYLAALRKFIEQPAQMFV